MGKEKKIEKKRIYVSDIHTGAGRSLSDRVPYSACTESSTGGKK
jgi:hypothetical protein